MLKRVCDTLSVIGTAAATILAGIYAPPMVFIGIMLPLLIVTAVAGELMWRRSLKHFKAFEVKAEASKKELAGHAMLIFPGDDIAVAYHPDKGWAVPQDPDRRKHFTTVLSRPGFLDRLNTFVDR